MSDNKKNPPQDGDVRAAAGSMILSPSGWRAVFAESGGGEDPSPSLSPAHEVIAVSAAAVFADYIKAKSAAEKPAAGKPAVIVGMDTRPTGSAIALAMIKTFLSAGCEARFVSAAAAPEIMAYARSAGADGFVYISASHNPIGHNGFKFGLCDGGVLAGGESLVVTEEFKKRVTTDGEALRALELLRAAKEDDVARVYSRSEAYKKEALAAYTAFTRDVVSGFAGEAARREDFFAALKEGLKETPLGIAADFNGSARTLSLDREFLSGLGVRFRAMNEKPGEIVHRIVPEGESLEPCRLWLEELHRNDPAFILGYVPDCDGDRGNIVFWDESVKKARSLEAQEVFALACVSELAQMVYSGKLSYDIYGNSTSKAAIAVNDPTSLRIDRIAQAFDISVFRAEVGEANVVALAKKLREEGYTVRILGEGSAGGNITHPSSVRDPISTVMAIVKLLVIRSMTSIRSMTGAGRAALPRSAERDRGLFELWCDLSDQAETYREDFTLSDVVASLPAFVTTPSYSGDALLNIRSADHAALKERYQKIFLREWEEKKAKLKERYGITGWEAAAYTGTEEKRGISRFGEAGRGGLKINFLNQEGRATASLWMRGSGTEAVFRIMADAEGSDPRLERILIEWQRHMVNEADKGE